MYLYEFLVVTLGMLRNQCQMREIQDSDNIRDRKVIAGDSFPCNLFDKV